MINRFPGASLAAALITLLVCSGLVLAQAPPAPADRPNLAKDVKEAMTFLGAWSRIPSGKDYFGDAKYVGPDACKGCHDQQIEEWKKTWHSKILREPTDTVVKAAFDGKPVKFDGVRAVAKGSSEPLGGLQNAPVSFEVRPEQKGGKFIFIIVDPKSASVPKGGQEYEVMKVIGGKWQQSFHVHPKDKDGNPTKYFFPAPLRWSINPDNPEQTSDKPKGWWEIVNFQPENWVWADGAGGAVPRAQFELPVARFGEAKCMGCHTTGFEFSAPPGSKPTEPRHWEMTGPGRFEIGCERCHGPASKHVEVAQKKKDEGKQFDPKDKLWIVHGLKDLSLDQQNQVCGQCHARIGGAANENVQGQIRDQRDLSFPNTDENGNLFLPADGDLAQRALIWSYEKPSTTPGGGLDTFWPDGHGKKSRTQWQDHVGSAHATKAGASCMTCHSFHGDAVEKDPQQQAKLRQPIKELCETCHTASNANQRPNAEMYAGTLHATKGRVDCADCHMGALGQRMTKTTDGPHSKMAAFDVSFHGMTIALFSLKNPELSLAGARGSCEGCHTDGRRKLNGSTPPPKNIDELVAYVTKLQAYAKGSIQTIKARMDSNARKSDADVSAWHKNAQDNLDMILRDGSMGAHSFQLRQNGNVNPTGGAGECLRVANLWAELACQKAGANCKGLPFQKITGTVPPPTPRVCFGSI